MRSFFSNVEKLLLFSAHTSLPLLCYYYYFYIYTLHVLFIINILGYNFFFSVAAFRSFAVAVMLALLSLFTLKWHRKKEIEKKIIDTRAKLLGPYRFRSYFFSVSNCRIQLFNKISFFRHLILFFGALLCQV